MQFKYSTAQITTLQKNLRFLEVRVGQKKERILKKWLTQKLDELLDEANRTVNGMTDPSEKFPDPTDRATAESERNFTLRIRDRERTLIGKIKKALERIGNGTYDLCEECEEWIAEGRLKARPVTTLCIECKTSQEVGEKVRGV